MLFELTHEQVNNLHDSIDHCFLFFKITTRFTEYGRVKVFSLNSHLIKRRHEISVFPILNTWLMFLSFFVMYFVLFWYFFCCVLFLFDGRGLERVASSSNNRLLYIQVSNVLERCLPLRSLLI